VQHHTNSVCNMLCKLICPTCKRELMPESEGLCCPACQRRFAMRRGILSFLKPDESFNPTGFQDKQERAWCSSAQLRERIRGSRLLTVLNRLRVQFSMSGRRDRIFYDEMRGGASDRLILDVGCGGGRHYFCEYGKVVGVDPVLDLLEISKTIYNEVYHASAFELPFADNTFDYVVSSDVIGHIPVADKDRMFAEMYRVLRPGGRTVHVIETDATNFWFRFAHRYPELFKKYFIELPGHISLELPSQVRARFLRHGFKEIRFRKYAGAILECGTISGLFDNEFKHHSSLIRLVVGIDRPLSRSVWSKETANLLLEPLARFLDAITPIDSATGALVVFEK
jgi:SAM-dependent methyltransferase